VAHAHDWLLLVERVGRLASRTDALRQDVDIARVDQRVPSEAERVGSRSRDFTSVRPCRAAFRRSRVSRVFSCVQGLTVSFRLSVRVSRPPLALRGSPSSRRPSAGLVVFPLTRAWGRHVARRLWWAALPSA
jgi:hypothetical protein